MNRELVEREGVYKNIYLYYYYVCVCTLSCGSVLFSLPDIFVFMYLLKVIICMQWVYNILDKKSEVERIIYEDPDAEQGFMVMPDMKWNEKLTEDLYVMGLVRKRGIRTLRDLTAVHLPMLKNMLVKGKVSGCPLAD